MVAKVAQMARDHKFAATLPAEVDPDLAFMGTHCEGWHRTHGGLVPEPAG
jgi:hypothetical protein